MQRALYKIWTQATMSISNYGNYYTMSTFLIHFYEVH